MRAALLLVAALAGCSRAPGVNEQADAGPALERAAIAAGVVRDPTATGLAGLYARDTDRLCIVGAGPAYRIGAMVDYGSGQTCSARGSVTQSGELLGVDFGSGCTFDARLDGATITFPGRLPAACDKLCTDRASLTALEVEQQSDAASEASALRDVRGKALCGS